MTKLIRCLGAAGLLALATLAGPGAGAAAAAPPSVGIDAPVAGTTQTAPFKISGSISQDGTDAAVISAKVKLTDDDGWLPPVEHNYSSGGTANSPIFTGGGASVAFDWTSIAPKYNGPYTVTVTATGQYRTTLGGAQQQSSTVSKSFRVEIPPATPTGVTAEKPEDSGIVTVKWKANPESDIAGYVVYRSYAGDAGKQVGSVDGSKTTWQDDLNGKAPGQYKYAVQAVRRARSCKSSSNTDEACSRGIAGKTSSYSAPVTVRATAPTTTTTTTKKSTGGGSGGGGSGGGTGGGGTGGGGTGGGGTTSGGTNSSNPAGVRRGTGGAGYAAGGEVDLSKFGSLLNPSGSINSTRRPGEPEGTYDPSLPYGERPLKQPNNDDGNLVTIGGASIPKPSDDWVKFIGAGSFVTAILVHVLWFKQQVDQVPLETID